MVLCRIGGASRVKGASSRLQDGDIACRRGVVLDCAWCHDGCCAMDCGLKRGAREGEVVFVGEIVLGWREKQRERACSYFLSWERFGAASSQILRIGIMYEKSTNDARVDLHLGDKPTTSDRFSAADPFRAPPIGSWRWSRDAGGIPNGDEHDGRRANVDGIECTAFEHVDRESRHVVGKSYRVSCSCPFDVACLRHFPRSSSNHSFATSVRCAQPLSWSPSAYHSHSIK